MIIQFLTSMMTVIVYGRKHRLEYSHVAIYVPFGLAPFVKS
jgi:hypothetical protein